MTNPTKRIAPEIAEAIRYRKAQYCRFLDSRQWDQLKELMLPDLTTIFYEPDGAVTRVGDFELSFSSRDEFVGFHEKQSAGIQMVHIVGLGEIEQIGPERVRAIWPIFYPVAMKQGMANGLGNFECGAYYDETWEYRGNDWFLRGLIGTTVYRAFK
nr:hypothetical protein [Aspergillus sp.]